MTQVELRWRGEKASGRCPDCGHRSAFGLEMDADMEGGKYHCFRCQESGFIVKGFLYKRGEKVEREHRTDRPLRRPLPHLAPKTYDSTIPAVAHVYEQVMEVYRSHYPASSGERYLRSRGFYEDPPGVGYAPGGRVLQAAGFNMDLLWNLGLVRKDGKDFMFGRVVMPYTWMGRVTCIFGRAADPKTPKQFRHLYTPCGGRSHRERAEFTEDEVARYPWLLSTGRYERWDWVRGVYGEAALKAPYFMVVEGALDVEAARLLGHPRALALGGTGISALLSRIRPEQRVVVSTDSSEALDANGELAAGGDAGEKAYEALRRALGPRAVRFRVPDGHKDWADYLKARNLVAASVPSTGGGRRV